MNRILPILFFIAAFYVSRAQELPESKAPTVLDNQINTSGGTALTSKGSISYSIGSLLVSGNLIASNQSNDINLTAKTSTKNVSIEPAEVLAYPNPTTDYILVDITDFDLENAQYQLFDYAGRLLDNGLIETATTKIPMAHLKKSYYLLKITVLNSFEQTLQIIKL
ncbi:T9SS type A sorting domain-containing protein [Euzebyella marina]|nr:T9SS type A sorting domain-containing protein [Euzebyella marina]